MAHRQKNPHLRDISSLRMVQWAFRVICRICGVKLTVKGQENVPKDIPVLYVANHNSYFDIMITYALCPDLTGYIAKDSLEKVPLLNIWMKRLYCLFLKRDDMKASLKNDPAGNRICQKRHFPSAFSRREPAETAMRWHRSKREV